MAALASVSRATMLLRDRSSPIEFMASVQGRQDGCRMGAASCPASGSDGYRYSFGPSSDVQRLVGHGDSIEYAVAERIADDGLK